MVTRSLSLRLVCSGSRGGKLRPLRSGNSEATFFTVRARALYILVKFYTLGLRAPARWLIDFERGSLEGIHYGAPVRCLIDFEEKGL